MNRDIEDVIDALQKRMREFDEAYNVMIINKLSDIVKLDYSTDLSGLILKHRIDVLLMYKNGKSSKEIIEALLILEHNQQFQQKLEGELD
jgi:hypothetical protein